MIVWGGDPQTPSAEPDLLVVVAAVLWLVLLTVGFPAAWDHEAAHEARARQARIAATDR